MSVEFVDTNILVYAHDRSAGNKQKTASELILRLSRSRMGALSLQVLSEFFVTVTRKIPSPIATNDALEIVFDFTTWRVHQPRTENLLAAMRVAEQYRLSLWDALIVQSATDVNATVLWSEDLNPGQTYSGVLLRNPFTEPGA